MFADMPHLNILTGNTYNTDLLLYNTSKSVYNKIQHKTRSVWNIFR